MDFEDSYSKIKHLKMLVIYTNCNIKSIKCQNILPPDFSLLLKFQNTGRKKLSLVPSLRFH